MMKLSTMLKAANTVDGEWRSPLAEKILERWGYDEGSVFAFRYSANFIFIFKRNEQTHFLRFNEVSEKDLASLEEEMNLLNKLAEIPLRVSKPVVSLNGKKVERIETELGEYYASVFEALSGKQYEMEELESHQFFTWGSTLGKLHEKLKKTGVTSCVDRMTWRDHLNEVECMLSSQDSAAKKELAALIKWAESLPVTKDNFGLIHYDFELDNLRWDGNRLGMLDFDDCAYYWYVADIAYALRDLEGKKMSNPLFAEFIKGYVSETSLDYQLLEQLPMFQRLHDLRMFARLLRSVDILESPEHPEWMENLRKKLVVKIENYRASFEKLNKDKKELLS
ncbi:phosphotransferase [Fictibacillus nanhaiensis]|uniref:phosphotransferase enzyme family protein n=1 Tax=Fictibacillus nanhaiensis TaxID=742169 RepID=UPI00203BCFAD|nr:phosphotransferase [Fictibacillus nanhaiensis]MCM3733396.1 phosphotransferase [Fictibacillus nanhaiensis]